MNTRRGFFAILATFLPGLKRTPDDRPTFTGSQRAALVGAKLERLFSYKVGKFLLFRNFGNFNGDRGGFETCGLVTHRLWSESLHSRFRSDCIPEDCTLIHGLRKRGCQANYTVLISWPYEDPHEALFTESGLRAIKAEPVSEDEALKYFDGSMAPPTNGLW